MGGATAPVPGPSTRQLGVYFDYSYQGPGIKVREVPRRAPGSYEKTRIKPADYILAVDGKEVRSCVMAVSRVAGKEVTTLEGLAARWVKQNGLPAADAEKTLHPVQQAWIDEQVPLCGFCQNGMMIKAAELLDQTPQPTVAQIKNAFTSDGPSPHLCRCGSYSAIIEAVQRASSVIAKRGER